MTSSDSIWKKMKPLLMFLLPSIAVGVVVGAYPGFRAYDYAWNDARFCITCHVHDYATLGWSNSIHGQLTTCHDCHHQPLKAYMIEAYLMATHPPKFPKDLHHTPYVKKDLCGACHLSGDADRSTITGPMQFEDVAKIPKVDMSHLHKLHLEKETELTLLNSHELSEGERDPEHPRPPKEFSKERGEKRPIVCADCHGGPANRGHNFAAVDGSCVRCHDKPHASKVGQEFGCRSCHFTSFLIPPQSGDKTKLK